MLLESSYTISMLFTSTICSNKDKSRQKTQLRVLSSNSDLREFTSIIINNPSWLVRVRSVWEIKGFKLTV